MTRLFAPSVAPRVLAAPPSAPFLEVLAERLAADVPNADDPFALADAIVLLPNRRAVRGLVDAFAARRQGVALLPAIKPLGDLDDDPDVWGPAALDLEIPPPIDPLRRRLELAALVRARDAASGGVQDPVRAIAAASELTKLLDAAAASDDIDWSRLATLVEERDLAAHWRKSVDFLQIIAAAWPAHLAENGLSDPAARRNVILDRLADLWSRAPPRSPVVIAGSTGSLPAVRRLMKVVAHLPMGAVVLPGLDSDLDDEAWAGIGPQHPQFGLKLTLQTLGVARADVATIAGAEPTAKAAARRALVREALVPADATADWLARLDRAGGRALVEEALDGLSRSVCETPEEEATVAALAMREALETPGRTAALVTPDQGLARRVAAKLRRYGIEVPVSAGAPLRETSIGVFLQLLCDLALDEGDPLALAALMQQSLAGLGLMEPERDVARQTVTDALRGPRRPGGLGDLIGRLSGPGRSALVAVRDALAPLQEAFGQEPVLLNDVARGLADAAERMAHTPDDDRRMWGGGAGEAAVRALRAMAIEGAAIGSLKARDAARVALALLGAVSTPPEGGDHPRLAIWGPLEARMQRRDLVILAGLNEGVWPEPAGDDPFLSRPMREALGLVSPDVRIGLAAHDFAQLACAPRVLLTRAQRRDGAPTVASRWLWRLETLVSGARQSDRIEADAMWLDLARRLDAPTRRARAAPPRPRPPVSARPRRLRVTEVETLIRDPYAIYARRVLGLEVKQAIGTVANAAARGTAIHAAIETFTRAAGHRDADAAVRFIALLDRAFADIGADEQTRAVERVRLARAAEAFVGWLRKREADGFTPLIEAVGALDLEDGFALRGRADRIDIGADGRASIVDYKTGAPPTAKEVRAGLAPQLPLEAVLLAEGGFEGAPRAIADEYVYWRFGGAAPGPQIVKTELSAAAMAHEARARFLELMRDYDDPDQPYLSKPRVKFAKEYADYDGLARRKEWADADGAE